MHLEPPAAVMEIAQQLRDRGYDAWAVGGAVRDALLGLPHADWDLATNARPDEVRRVFRRTVPIGVEHGTVGVLARDGVLYEVTTFRRDVETDGCTQWSSSPTPLKRTLGAATSQSTRSPGTP
jgi:tRNA nucleotidyltransferase/poly(A) polymerase